MEPEESDFSVLLQNFVEIFKFCEGLADSVDAEAVFQSAKIVENTCSKLESVGALEDFENKLNEFWVLKGLKVLPIQFFKRVADEVLCRFMTDGTFSDTSVKCAINQFILIRSEEDFVKLVKRLSNTQHSVELLKRNSDLTGVLDYNAERLLEQLTKQLVETNGSTEELDSTISNIFSNNWDRLKVFIKVLCLTNRCDLSQCVQNLIAIHISNIVRNPENINFFSHFLDLADDDFNKVVYWKPLSETLIKMIEFSLEHLKCNYTDSSYSWGYSGSEKGLSFDIITALINKLKKSGPEINIKIKELLQRLKAEGFEIIAEDFLRICKIK
uniref:Uncharacterized protein n=1 Tax=Graphocephala atropunctata TaxID=36148 RepID=A0A1B6KQT7_9HEMI